MAGLIGWLASRMRRAGDVPAFQRDPEFLARWAPALSGTLRWFRPSVAGGDNVRRHESLILVANHSGGLWTPEAYILVDWWLKTFGSRRSLYLLAHDFLFAIPGFNQVLRRAGGIPANMENARRALDDGGSVLVFPGGDREAFRPWWHRDRIDFSGRTGFVRLALRAGTPVVPVVSHGSHDTTIVLARGGRLARRLHLRRLRSAILPIVLGVPWGVVPGFVPTLPLPARVDIQLLPPLDWRDLGGEAAADSVLVHRCYDQTVDVMQRTLDAMVRERPWPLLERWQRS